MIRKIRVAIPEEKIIEFCKKWKVREFALFGSVLREDFCPDSDIDVLVKFDDEARHTLFDLIHDDIDLTIVWETVSRDLPQLINTFHTKTKCFGSMEDE